MIKFIAYFFGKKVLAVFVKRCHKRLNQKRSDAEQRLYERHLSVDEPNLDEFSVSIDDRVSKQRVAYAREILLETPPLLFAGRRRESV